MSEFNNDYKLKGVKMLLDHIKKGIGDIIRSKIESRLCAREICVRDKKAKMALR